MNKSRFLKNLTLVFLLSLIFLPTSSLKAATTLRIGFVTDWEYAQNNKGGKLSKKAPKYLKSVVKRINKKRPDLVIGGGDYIRGDKLRKKKAKSQLKKINNVFKKLKASEIYYVVGNHDLRSLDTDSYKSALNIDYLHKVIDKNGFRLILLDTNYKENGEHYSDESYASAYVSTEELNWLSQQITESPDPVIIFSHHSPMEKNGRQDIKNAAEVKEVIQSSGKVVAVISGHNPTQYHKEENGVHYIIINNLTSVKSRRTYAFIEAQREGNDVELKITQKGKKKRIYLIQKSISLD